MSVDEEKNVGDEDEDLKTEQSLNALVAAMIEPPPPLAHCRSMHDTASPQGAWVHTHIYAHGDVCEIVPRAFSSEISLAMRVEDRIAELGLQNDYIAHLWDEVGAGRDGANFWTAQNFNAFWLCVHATPEQRCRAALKATECLSSSARPDDGQAS